MARNPEFERKHPRDPANGEFVDKPTGGWVRTAAGRLGELPTTAERRDWLTRAADQSRRGVSTDAELDARYDDINQVIDANRHLSSGSVHREDGRWSSERAAMHRQIVDSIIARHGHVPRDRQAILSGGLGGAGKTTTLTGHAGINMSQYLMLSPDDMKDEIIAHGGTPEVPGRPDLSPMERSTLFHQESSYLTDMLGEAAYSLGMNVIIDATMGERAGPEARIRRLRESGYGVRGVFVDVPVETALERVRSRYRQGQRDYEQGRGTGGRPVPPQFVLQQRGSSRLSKNREVFDEMAGEGIFDDWQVYDNAGTAPRLIDKR